MNADSTEIDYSTEPTSLSAIEDSLRWPLLHGIVASALWLFVGSLLALVASLQVHSPGLFADGSVLTHGKTKAAAWNIVLYGFALQMAITVSLYLICRLSQKGMRHAFTVFVGSKLWNLGVLLGVIGIFSGDATGHEFFGMPVYATGVLFLGFAVMAIKGLMTLHCRANREMYISQVHLGAGAIWFLWAISTAIVVLQLRPTVGAVQLVVNQWYVANVFQIVLGGAGLAAAYYYLPQLAGRPLHSKELAITSFWMLVFIGSWAGISGQFPLPAWVSGVSSVAGFMLVVPVGIILNNLWKTISPNLGDVWSNTGGRAIIRGVVCYAVWIMGIVLMGAPAVSSLLQFTHFDTAMNFLFLFGFVGLTMLGATTHILPRIANAPENCDKFRMVLRVYGAGVVITVASLILAGFQQGMGLYEPAFLASVTAASFMLKLGSVGALVLVIGSFMFLMGVIMLTFDYLKTEFPVEDWISDDEAATAEVEAGN